MVKRITINGIQIARVDTELCDNFMETQNYRSLSEAVKTMMEETFHHKAETKEDFEWITEFLHKRHYENIADWLKNIMRMRMIFPGYITPFVHENVVFEHCCKECSLYINDMCVNWQCVVDPENNKGIEQCFSPRSEE